MSDLSDCLSLCDSEEIPSPSRSRSPVDPNPPSTSEPPRNPPSTGRKKRRTRRGGLMRRRQWQAHEAARAHQRLAPHPIPRLMDNVFVAPPSRVPPSGAPLINPPPPMVPPPQPAPSLSSSSEVPANRAPPSRLPTPLPQAQGPVLIRPQASRVPILPRTSEPFRIEHRLVVEVPASRVSSYRDLPALEAAVVPPYHRAYPSPLD